MTSGEPADSGGQSLLLWGLGFALVCAYSALAFFADDQTPCGIANLTGWPCPGCGLTRALYELMRGDLAAAHRQHPLVLLLLGEGLVVSVMLATRRPPSKRTVVLVLGTTVLLLLVVWVLRLATGTAPAV